MSTDETAAYIGVQSLLASDWERDFSSNLLNTWRGELTPKQDAVLQRLFAKCGGKAEKAA